MTEQEELEAIVVEIWEAAKAVGSESNSRAAARIIRDLRKRVAELENHFNSKDCCCNCMVRP